MATVGQFMRRSALSFLVAGQRVSGVAYANVFAKKDQSSHEIAAPIGTLPPSSRTLAYAAIGVVVAGSFVKLAGMGKEMVLAGLFGRGDAMDALLIALLLPNLLINLFAESMNQALIPTLIQVRLHEGTARAQQLVSQSALALCVLLVSGGVLLGVAAHVVFPLMGWNFGADKLHLAVLLFYALLPFMLLSGIASYCTSILNACGQFAIPALAPALIPLVTLALTPLLYRTLGIWAVVWATLLGALLHAGWMITRMNAAGFKLRPRWYGWNRHWHTVMHQYGAVFLSSIAASAGLLVDQAMAASLAAGSVAALVFAGRFVSIAVTLLSGAIASTLGPHFSVLAARGDFAGCRTGLRTWTVRAALVSVSIAIVLVAGAPGIVRLTLQRGAFHAADTEIVARTLRMYALQVPFCVTSRVFYRFIVALRRTDLVLYCGLVNLALDVVLNVVLMRSMGVAGIALATSLWSICTFTLLGFWTFRLLARAEDAGGAYAGRVPAEN